MDVLVGSRSELICVASLIGAGNASRMPEIRAFPSGYIQTNAFLVSDLERKEAVLVDAPHFVWDDVAPALAENGCSLKALFLTHGHYDHIGDAARIQKLGYPVYGHRDDQVFYETPETMRSYAYPLDMTLEPVVIDHWVEQGDKIDIIGDSAEVRHVPGHCPGNILFYFKSFHSAFVGDALFSGSIGRTDLPSGDFQTLERSIREQIYTLDRNTVVYPGHGPETIVGQEMDTNPFVSMR